MCVCVGGHFPALGLATRNSEQASCITSCTVPEGGRHGDNPTNHLDKQQDGTVEEIQTAASGMYKFETEGEKCAKAVSKTAPKKVLDDGRTYQEVWMPEIPQLLAK